MENRQMRYCTASDGVRIAYGVQGDGPPLLLCPVFIEAVSISHLSADFEAYANRVGRGRRLVSYDARGTGMSQRDVADFSHDALVRDVEAVADAAGLDEFDILGLVLSGPRAIEYASRHPGRIRHLILYNTFARGRDVMPPEVAAALVQVARADWAIASQMLTDLQGRKDAPNQNADVLQLMRESMTGSACAAFIEGLYETTDVTEKLSGISVPTFVVHTMEQQLVKAALGMQLAATIPDAKFMALSGDTLWIIAAQWEGVFDAVDKFLAPDAGGESSPARVASLPVGGLCAVLFTDVVGHTAIMSRLGDTRGRAILREHEAISRETLAEFGGYEVKAMGDGFMASFASVGSAMDCAVTLQRKFATRNESADEPLYIRIGLNAGEPIQEDGDLFGAMVITAARVAAKAEAGEILIPEPVRHLVAGKHFVFADRGETLLKGFEDAVRLYEVSWKP